MKGPIKRLNTDNKTILQCAAVETVRANVRSHSFRPAIRGLTIRGLVIPSLATVGIITSTLPFTPHTPAQTLPGTELPSTELPSTELPTPTTGLRYNPPNRGAPGDASTSDAGSRSCGLMVFEPAQSHWGETLQAFPSFWLQASNPGNVRFELVVEETAEVIYQSTFELSEGQAMTRYTLPESAPPLAVDQAYRWRFALDCPGDPDPFANGLIVRRQTIEEQDEQSESETLNESTEETTLSPPNLEQAKQLAAAGLWFDTVEALNQLRLAEAHEASTEESISESMTESISESITDTAPSASTQAWQDLLRQGGWEIELGNQFETVSTAPFASELLAVTTETAKLSPCEPEESSP